LFVTALETVLMWAWV